jgi:hypothetical protein
MFIASVLRQFINGSKEFRRGLMLLLQQNSISPCATILNCVE